MTVTIPVVAADGAQSTVTLPDPVVGSAPTYTVQSYSDVTNGFFPYYAAPVVAHPPQFQSVSTPYGPGFQINCADTDVTTWATNMKTVNVQIRSELGGKVTAIMNQSQHYDFYVYLPTQNIVTSWNGGNLINWHSRGNSSGQQITLDNTGRGPGGKPSWRWSVEGGGFTYGPNIVFDTWHHITVDVRWSTGTDGFYKVTLDGQQIINKVNWATVFESDRDAQGNIVPYLGLAWYSDIGTAQSPPVANSGTNTVIYGGVSMTVTG